MSKKIKTKAPLLVELKTPSWKYRIIKAVFWLMLVAFILPITTGLVLNYYKNQQQLNNFLIKNAFPELQKHYNSYMKSLYKIAVLEGRITTNIKLILFIEQSRGQINGQPIPGSFELICSLWKNNEKNEKKVGQGLINLNNNLQTYLIAQNKAAQLLEISMNPSSKYMKIFNQFNNSLNRASNELKQRLVQLSKQNNLPEPTSPEQAYLLLSLILKKTATLSHSSSSKAIGYQIKYSLFYEETTKARLEYIQSLYLAFSKNFTVLDKLFYQKFNDRLRLL
jgi:hypothetical protein